MEIDGKFCVVTGAARGIGRETALLLARAGAGGVAVVDVDEAGAQETAREIEEAGVRAIALSMDLADAGAAERMLGQAVEAFGRIDVLHNNAGLGEGPGGWPDVSAERIAQIVDVNLRAVILGTRAALDRMPPDGGAIVNTASGSAHVPFPIQAVYAATKAGVAHFTRCCAPLAESHGVRVNCVCPGLTDTPMLDDTGENGRAPWMDELVGRLELIPAARVAQAVVDLIRNDSAAGEVIDLLNDPAS